MSKRKLLPHATRNRLVGLLRHKGFDIPRRYEAKFNVNKRSRSYYLTWYDGEGNQHQAYYTGCAGKPLLSVDDGLVDLSLVEVIQWGLFEEADRKA